jgi:hypothetical protein
MNKISACRFLFLAWTLPLFAADSIETQWSDVCKLAGKHQLSLTTVDGDTVDGYCIKINADEIAVTTFDRRTIRIARTALSRLQLHRTKGHQLASLGKGVRSGLRQGADWLLSPRAILGVVTVPATLAWGATSAPFCILGDLVDKLTPQRDIKLLADSATPPAPGTAPIKSNP